MNDDKARYFIAAVFFISLFGGMLHGWADPGEECPDGTCPQPQLIESLADIPPQMRQPNWAPNGFGSCVHASTITILRWQGQYHLAEWWRNTYSSGEYANRLIARMNAAGLRYAYEKDGDIRFLEWCSRNRLCAGIFYFPRHAVNLVDLNETHAVLLDNNRTGEYIHIPRDEFIRNWRGYGGFAWTVCYATPPPYPSW
jgi:hypothetical protein